MTPHAHGGESPAERLDVMEHHIEMVAELLKDDLRHLREDLEHGNEPNEPPEK